MERKDTLLKCLELEWQDHFQTRQQTWKTLQIEAAMVVALIGIDWKINNQYATLAASVLLILSTIFGILITLRHRQVEILKISNIITIEKELGVDDVFNKVSIPSEIKWYSFLTGKSNTSLFILRIHIIIMLFGVIYPLFRLITK